MGAHRDCYLLEAVSLEVYGYLLDVACQEGSFVFCRCLAMSSG